MHQQDLVVPLVVDDRAAMTPRERAELVLSFARVLHVNGESTNEMMVAAERLGRSLDLDASIQARWGELQLQSRNGDATGAFVKAADPTGIDMDRVVSAMRAAADLHDGAITPSAFGAAIRAISQAPPAPTWLFTLAAAAGAAALAVLFGVQHLAALGLIIGSAASRSGLRGL